MHDQPDSVDDCQHPDPAVERLVPDQELLNVLVNYDVDGVEEAGALTDRTY